MKIFKITKKKIPSTGSPKTKLQTTHISFLLLVTEKPLENKSKTSLKDTCTFLMFFYHTTNGLKVH